MALRPTVGISAFDCVRHGRIAIARTACSSLPRHSHPRECKCPSHRPRTHNTDALKCSSRLQPGPPALSAEVGAVSGDLAGAAVANKREKRSNHKGCTRTRTIHHEHGVKQSTITIAINQIIVLAESTHRLHVLSDERSTHRAVLLILGERRESTWTRGPKLPPLHGIGTLNQIQSLGQRLKHEHERMHSSNAHAL